jgi:hypothetical protein
MGISIKSPVAETRIRELATLRGVSLVAAVTEAVEEKLEKEKAEAIANKKKSRYELLMEFAKECGPLFKDGRSSNDLINDLYDDATGLPK